MFLAYTFYQPSNKSRVIMVSVKLYHFIISFAEQLCWRYTWDLAFHSGFTESPANLFLLADLQINTGGLCSLARMSSCTVTVVVLLCWWQYIHNSQLLKVWALQKWVNKNPSKAISLCENHLIKPAFYLDSRAQQGWQSTTLMPILQNLFSWLEMFTAVWNKCGR